MEKIQISAKALGAMAMPDFCPRCFWIKLHQKKLPYQSFPGIFSTIDSYTKKIVHAWIDAKKDIVMLKKYGVKGYAKSPHWSKFKIETEYGITFTGGVDDIWIVDGGIVIPDYKTAKKTENADKLLPTYKVQLNGYAKIAEATGMGKVIAIPLIYMEPQTSQSFVDFNSQTIDIWDMSFIPKIIEVDIDRDMVDKLLRQARIIYDDAIPKLNKECKDCKALEDVFNLCK